jgi:hypothetical protein
MSMPRKPFRTDPARLIGESHFRIDELHRRIDALEQRLEKRLAMAPTKVGTIDLASGPVSITLRELR